jgi:hypothetical protein
MDYTPGLTFFLTKNNFSLVYSPLLGPIAPYEEKGKQKINDSRVDESPPAKRKQTYVRNICTHNLKDKSPTLRYNIFQVNTLMKRDFIFVGEHGRKKRPYFRQLKQKSMYMV